MAQHRRPNRELTAVSAAFLENSLNLKKFLTRLVSNQRDIEDVVQDTYLRAFVSEQRKTVAQPQAFLFRDLATLRLDAPVFASVDALRWTGPRPEFEALAKSLGAPELSDRARAIAAGRRASGQSG